MCTSGKITSQIEGLLQCDRKRPLGLWKPVDDSLFCCFFCSFVIVHFPALTQPFLHAYPVLFSPRSNHHSQNGSVAGAQLADPGTTALGLNAALPLSSCVPSAGVASWSLYSFFCKMEFLVAILKHWRENGDFVGKPLARGSTVNVNSRVLSWYIITRIQGSWCPKGCCFSHLWRELLKQYIMHFFVFDQSSLAMIGVSLHWVPVSWAGPWLTRAGS